MPTGSTTAAVPVKNDVPAVTGLPNDRPAIDVFLPAPDAMTEPANTRVHPHEAKPSNAGPSSKNTAPAEASVKVSTHPAKAHPKTDVMKPYQSRSAKKDDPNKRPWAPFGGWSTTRRNWTIAGVVAVLLLGSIGAALLFSNSKSVPTDYVEIYLTDIPGDFERVVLLLDGAYVGKEQHALTLEITEIDILAYRGTEHAARVAYGDVPRGNHTEVTLVFASAAGLLDGQWVPIEVPQEALQVSSGFATGGSSASAVLLDLDMERSLVLTERGFTFQPHVANLYFHNFENGQAPQGAASSGGKGTLSDGGFKSPPIKDPAQKRDDRQIAPPPGGGGGASFFPTNGGTRITYTRSNSISSSPRLSGSNSRSTDFASTDIVRTETDPTTTSDGPGPGVPPPDDEEEEDGLPIPVDALDGGADTNCGPDNPDDPTCSGLGQDPGDVQDLHDYIVRFIPQDPDDPSTLIDSETESVMDEDEIKIGAEIITWYGGTVQAYLKMSPAMIAKFTPQQAASAGQDSKVAFIEKDVDVLFSSTPSAREVTHWNHAQDSLGGTVVASKLTHTGKGVGVAIVDTGVDATHPDLPFDLLGTRASNAVVYENFKMEAGVSTRVPNSDTVVGSHGTYVAGIIAGQPSATVPNQYGMAPGAKVYAWGVGESTKLTWVAQAYDDLLFRINEGNLNPKIRVVTNSWSTGTFYDPNSIIVQQVNDLVDRGIVVVFSAGNDGGNGAKSLISAQCQIPREGVICVGGFEDFDKGIREQGAIYYASSRGAITDARTWPDLVAPATRIQSTKSIVNTIGLTNPYGTMSGTSIAAPQVAAAVALMFEVNPHLVPAQVEYILEQSAFKFADGGGYAVSEDYRYDGAHYAKGHGLLDIDAALRQAAPSAENDSLGAGTPVGLLR